MPSRQRRLISAALIGFGLVFYAIAAGIVRVDESSIYAPRWVLALIGGIFFTPGLMLLAEGNPRLQQLLAAALMASFAAVGGIARAARRGVRPIGRRLPLPANPGPHLPSSRFAQTLDAKWR